MSSFDVQNLFGVNGKVVLVTGGSRGIGKMVCALGSSIRSLRLPAVAGLTRAGLLPNIKDCHRLCEEWCQGAELCS